MTEDASKETDAATKATATTSKHALPAAKDTSGKPTMHVKITSPFKVYFDEVGYSLSGINATGPFDILPHHHNFISLLNECELTIQTANGPKHVKISGGLMHVKADYLSVFLNI